MGQPVPIVSPSGPHPAFPSPYYLKWLGYSLRATIGAPNWQIIQLRAGRTNCRFGDYFTRIMWLLYQTVTWKRLFLFVKWHRLNITSVKVNYARFWRVKTRESDEVSCLSICTALHWCSVWICAKYLVVYSYDDIGPSREIRPIYKHRRYRF